MILRKATKEITKVLIAGVFLALGYFVYTLYINPLTVCDKTLKYSLGDYDPRFGITEEEVLTTINKAENMWESPAVLNLFEYDEEAEFKINFLFDERQQITIEAKGLESKLEDLRVFQSSILEKYNPLHEEYEEKMSAYSEKVNDFEERLKDYNSKVNKWNKKGGAPGDVYEDLQDEEKELDEISKELEKERVEVNDLAAQINSLVLKEGEVVEKYNKELMTYENKYGKERQFDQGDYDGVKINIYQFIDTSDLRLILAHELGHALGVGHLEKTTSVMHYLMRDQDLEAGTVTMDDIEALQGICNSSKSLKEIISGVFK